MPRFTGDKQVRQLIYEKYDGRCAYCGCDLVDGKYHIDHIIPRRRKAMDHEFSGERGTDDIDNYNPSCASCNSMKCDFSIEEFRYQLSQKVLRLNKYYSLYRAVKRYGLIRETGNDVVFHFERVNHG